MDEQKTAAAPRCTEEQLVRIRLDALIRQTWCALRDLSDYRNGEALTQEDLDLWGRITPHPAIQRVLDRAIANSLIGIETDNGDAAGSQEDRP